jgi:heme A synthase
MGTSLLGQKQGPHLRRGVNSQMDAKVIWEWLRPMVGFFIMGVFLLLLVYVFIRAKRKRGSMSNSPH